jgi:hypothetical protein
MLFRDSRDPGRIGGRVIDNDRPHASQRVKQPVKWFRRSVDRHDDRELIERNRRHRVEHDIGDADIEQSICQRRRRDACDDEPPGP